ncbi:MAG: cation:proton antiporter [Thermacetogeniaceae bacterium]|jgi:NhaP-type Na+/H+ or K+/H+ antiporter
MSEQALFALTAIIVVGITAQWLAWRFKIPSIFLLILLGIISGPVLHLIAPDQLFGNLLFPLTSLAVALILFEGGLNLKIDDLKQAGAAVRGLICVGAIVTWLAGALAGRLLLGLDFPVALLLGAILVVTGPTVIVPLLRQVPLKSRLAAILRWEGILIDPLGAMLAVLVFEARFADGMHEAIKYAFLGAGKTILLGGVFGLLGAGLIVLLIKRYYVPGYLQIPVTLTVIVSVFAMANLLQTESGLLAVTILGIGLANQKMVDVRHIINFYENLRVILLSSLFAVLAARLSLNDLGYMLSWNSLAFLGLLIFVVRPGAVALGTIGAGLSRQERIFLGFIAPRGIVAASVSSIFALQLQAAGVIQAEHLEPVTFLIIIGTVTVYGLSAAPLARRLGVSG